MKRILLASLLVSVAMFAIVSLADEGKATSVKGWVTDTMCGAKGMSNDHAACVKKCVNGGAKLALVTDKGDKVYTVENAEALAGHEGHHVEVKGHISGDSLNVSKDSVKMLDQKAAVKNDDMHK
jgi:hypothetical protein